jgi:hypothetical protein
VNSLSLAFFPPPAVLAGFAAGAVIGPLLFFFSRGPLRVAAVGDRYPRAALWAFLLYALALLALGFGPVGLAWQDALAGLCILVTAVLLQEVFWGLLTFGFSLNLLAVLARHGGAVTLDEWAALFGGESGVAGISGNRLEILLKLRMIELQGNAVRLTPLRGRWMALAARLAMAYFAIDRRWR